MGTETDAFLREVKWPVTSSEVEVNQANLQALKMLGASGAENGDTQQGASAYVRTHAYATGPYARAREYARAHDYWGLFKEARAKRNYPSYYTRYHRNKFWREFVNFTPEMKVAFATKFEAAKVKYPTIFEYYVEALLSRFWLDFLEWDTQQQTAYASAYERAREKYPGLMLRYAAQGRKEKWTDFVNMSPEAQKIHAQRVQEIVDKEKREREMEYVWDHGDYGKTSDGYENRVETRYDKNGHVEEVIYHGR